MDLTIMLAIPVVVIIAILIYVVKASTENNGKNFNVGIIIMAAVSIVIVGSLLAPIVNETTEVTTLQYDDYFETSATTASGSLELVDIDGTTYAHAKSLGEATLVTPGGIRNYNVEKADLDVWLLTGQSNAAYFRYDSTTATPIPSLGTSYYYGTDSAPITYTTFDPDDYDIYDMISTTTGEAKIGNIELPFAGQYQTLGDHKVLVINGALSGAPIEKFVPNAEVYEYMVDVFADAMSKIDETYYNIYTKGTIWAQGESNSSTPVDQYKMYFMEMYNAVSGQDQAHVFNADYDLPLCMIVQTREANSTNAPTAQEELAAETDGIYLATDVTQTFTVENGLMNSDDEHYSQLGDNMIGVALADYYYETIGSSTEITLAKNVFHNQARGFWEMDYEETVGDHTITITAATENDPAAITIDDVSWNLSNLFNYNDIAFICNSFVLTMGNISQQSAILSVGDTSIGVQPKLGEELSLIIENGTANITRTLNGETTATQTIPITGGCYIATLEGDYCAVMSGDWPPVYLKSEDMPNVAATKYAGGHAAILFDEVCRHGTMNVQRTYTLTNEVVGGTDGQILKITDAVLSDVTISGNQPMFIIVPKEVSYT